MADFAAADDKEAIEESEDGDAPIEADPGELEEPDEAPDVLDDEAALKDDVYLEWADDWGIHDEGEVSPREAIEENARILRNTNQDLWKAVDELREDVEVLREENQQLRDRLDSLEGWKGNAVKSVNQNTHDLDRLVAAVFDNEPPCPECGSGHLEADTGGFGSDTIGCSDCEYEEQLV